MVAESDPDRLGLELVLQRPRGQDARRNPKIAEEGNEPLFPELDADGDHVHFEMVPMHGESLLWLTIRRGTSPELAAKSLRKIADLIERHGERLLTLLGGGQGSFSSSGEIISAPLRLSDEHGDVVLP
jgi:hypothetical protein